MQDTINYIADDTKQEVALPVETGEQSPMAAIMRARFIRDYPNVIGYLKDDKGHLLGLTTDKAFTTDDMPDGWLFDENNNTVIVPNLKTQTGQSDYDKFNRIADMDIPVKAGGFTPNAGDLTTQTTTPRPTTTGRGDNPALKKT